MNVEVLVVGDEVLAGITQDTNSAYIAREMQKVGIHLQRVSQIGDVAADIQRLASDAMHRADALIITGGLGPTVDDHTKEDMAELLQDDLVLDSETLEDIRQRFERAGLQMPEINRKQAFLPKSGGKIPNPVGSAPGVHWHRDSCDVFLLPGVPAEMRAMMQETVLPHLRDRLPRDSGTVRHVFRTTGVAESILAEKIQPVMQQHPATKWTFYPRLRGLDVHVMTGPTDGEKVQRAADAARLVLQDLVFSETPGEELEEVVGQLFRSQSRTLVVAESCTGGMLGERLTAIPGSSRYFLGGWVTYSNRMKEQQLGVDTSLVEKHGAVSAEVAVAMARGARLQANADVGVAITGIAGPDGGTVDKPVGLVFVALARANAAWLRRLQLTHHRAFNRERATQVALDMLRREAMDLEIGDAVP